MSASQLSLSASCSRLLRLFRVWTGHHWIKSGIHFKGLGCSSCLTAGGGIYEELRSGRSFPVIFPIGVHRSKLTVQIEQVQIQLFSNRAVGTMQVRAIHPHRPTILSCLYYDSSNCVNSILWFLYRRSSRTPSTVCLWFILPLFFSGASPALLPPAPEGSPDQCSIRALSP